MEDCLIRLTPNDYREFRRAYSRIRYSFFENDQGDQLAVEMACKIATETNTRPKGEFLNHLEDSNREMFFFMVDGEIQGYVELVFEDKVCNIFEFAVFEHRKGWGTQAYNAAYEIIKQRGCVKIELWCPYDGAQIFWKKKGFKPFYRNQELMFRQKVR